MRNSDGLHSNGYSLARRVLIHNDTDLDRFHPELGEPVGETLLRPTRIYVKGVVEALSTGAVNGVAHVTGGGITGNLPRILPTGCGAELRREAWPCPAIFALIQRVGQIAQDEMQRVFNMGLGMILIVSAGEAERLVSLLAATGENASIVGQVVEGEGVSFV